MYRGRSRNFILIRLKRAEVVFQIGLHKKDFELLKSIKAYFGDVGTIS